MTRRKNARKAKASDKKPLTSVKNPDKECLIKNKCDLDEENSSIEEEIPNYEDEAYLEPFRVKLRSLIANISSYIATMEINIFYNWSCIAPEPQDIFYMLEGAEKLSLFIEEKFNTMENNKGMQLEVENIKYTHCRSRIIVYIIKNILGRLGDVNYNLTYEKIVISEVNRHLHLIKKFGLKLPTDCSILKINKNRLLFSDFVVMIEPDLGTFSLKQTEEAKGILKRPADEICKSNFPISFLEEGSTKSFETQFSHEMNNFEGTPQTSKNGALSIEEKQIKKIDTSECGSPDIHENKIRMKLRANRSVSSNKKLNIINNSDESSSLGSEITNSFPETSVFIPTYSDCRLGRKKRVFNKKNNKLKGIKLRGREALNIHANETKMKLRATTYTTSFKKFNIESNHDDGTSLRDEINSFPGTSLCIPNNSDHHSKKERAYNKKSKGIPQTSKNEALSIKEEQIKRKLRGTPQTSKNEAFSIEEKQIKRKSRGTPQISKNEALSTHEKHIKRTPQISKTEALSIEEEQIKRKLRGTPQISKNEALSSHEKQIKRTPQISNNEAFSIEDKQIKRKSRVTSSTTSPKRLKIGNNPDEASLQNATNSFLETSSFDPGDPPYHLERKKRGYYKKSKDNKKSVSVDDLVTPDILTKEIDKEDKESVSVDDLVSPYILTKEIDKEEKESDLVDDLISPDILTKEINKEDKKSVSVDDLVTPDILTKEINKENKMSVSIDDLFTPDILTNEIYKEDKDSLSVPTNISIKGDFNNVIKEKMEFEENKKSVSVDDLVTPDILTKEINKEDKESVSDDLVTPDILTKEIDKEDKKSLSVPTDISIKGDFNNDVIKEEIEFKGELIIAPNNVSHEETVHSEKMNDVVINTQHVETATQTSFSSGSINLEATNFNLSSKMLDIPKCSGKSLLNSKDTSFPGTSLITGTNVNNNVEKKKRKYIRKKKVEVCQEMGPPDVKAGEKKKRKRKLKNTVLEDSTLPCQGQGLIKEQTVSQAEGMEEALGRIDSSLCNRPVNFKKYKKSKITIPIVKTTKSCFEMDLKTFNNDEKLTNNEVDFLSKEDIVSVHQSEEVVNQMNQDFQQSVFVCGSNYLDLDQGMNSGIVETSRMNCDVEIEVSSKNLEESITTDENKYRHIEKTSGMASNIEIKVPNKNLEETTIMTDKKSHCISNKTSGMASNVEIKVPSKNLEESITTDENNYSLIEKTSGMASNVEIKIPSKNLDESIKTDENNYSLIEKTSGMASNVEIKIPSKNLEESIKTDENNYSLIEKPSGMASNVEIKIPNKNLEETTITTDKKSHCISNKTSGIDCDVEIKVPSRNLDETEKTSHNLKNGFTAVTLENIVQIIDDTSYEGNNSKKTSSVIIDQSKGPHLQYFNSRENSIMHEHNYIKTHSMSNEFKSNSGHDCSHEALFCNKALVKANSCIVKNAPSNSSLINKNVHEDNNNLKENKFSNHTSSYQTDSLGINSIKVNSDGIEERSEELMNTEQFLQNSMDINYSQNIMPSTKVSVNDLNSVSLSNITKFQHFKGNKVTSATKSIELDFSDLNWG